jgi:16S rRNA (uracil1498-N3)-methyltransferase
MPHFYTPAVNISQDTVIINDKEQVHHLKNVLRLKLDDNLTIFDGNGSAYAGIIDRINLREVRIRIKGQRAGPEDPQIELTLACAIPKNARFDDIVDKLTQLGVQRIIPMITQRTVVKIAKDKAEAKIKRWKKIALSASEQSQRSTLAAIEPVMNIRGVLAKAQDFDLKLIPTLEGERRRLKEVLVQSPAKKILVLIGPEGDFTPEEIKMAFDAGCIPISLGDTVLRVDTAAIAVASVLMLGALI